jgi:signal transduction histidine kinase
VRSGLLDELAAIYRDAPVGLCVVDAKLRYRRVDPVWAEAFDVPRPDGSTARVADGPPVLVDALRSAIAHGAPVTVEIETAEFGGPGIWQTVVAPLRDESGAIGGASAVATDVTAIREAERALRLADERKDRFLSMLAHELRNPLAPMSNGLAVLERLPEGEQARHVRQVMRHRLARMVRMVDDLLDVSRVNLGKLAMRLEWVDVGRTCRAAVDSVRHAIDERVQTLETVIDPDLPRVRADRVRLEQVVSDLLANASRFGREYGRIRLEASTDPDCVRIAVEDDGRGISPEFLPHAFETFAQEDATDDRADGGLRIGLSLVAHLVAMHGGRVRAHSDGVGRGARFVVTLPVRASTAGARATPRTPRARRVRRDPGPKRRSKAEAAALGDRPPAGRRDQDPGDARGRMRALRRQRCRGSPRGGPVA